MKKQPEYTYERDSSCWTVVRWRKGNSVFFGEKIETYLLMEDARRRVFELNGWNYKPKK